MSSVLGLYLRRDQTSVYNSTFTNSKCGALIGRFYVGLYTVSYFFYNKRLYLLLN